MTDEKIVQHPDAAEEILVVGGPHHGELWKIPLGEQHVKMPFEEDDGRMIELLYLRQTLGLPASGEKVDLLVHATC